MQQRTTQTSNEKSLLTEVIYSYYKTFRIVKPDSNGVYPPVWFPGSNEPDPAVDVQLKVNLHILWQEQRYVLDLNEVFDVQNHILQMSTHIPNMAGVHEANSYAIQDVFSWLIEIMHHAARILKTGEFGFGRFDDAKAPEPTHLKGVYSPESIPMHGLFNIMELVEPRTKIKWEVLTSGDFINSEDEKLSNHQMLRRIMRNAPGYKITKAYIPALAPQVFHVGEQFGDYEINSFTLDKFGKFWMRLVNTDVFDDHFDQTFEINKTNIHKIGKLLFPIEGETLDENK